MLFEERSPLVANYQKKKSSLVIYESQPKLGLIFEVLVNTLCKKSLKCLCHIASCICACLKVLVTSFGAPLSNISRVHFSSRCVTFVSTNDDFDSIDVDTISTHLFLPVDQGLETVFVINIIDHDNAICIFIEILANQSIFIITRKVEKVDRYRLVFHSQFFHTIVHTNGGDVPFHETAFTVALDKTTFTNF